MFYRNIIKEAWTLVWRRKILWFFGIFASFAGVGGALDVATNVSMFNVNPSGFYYSFLRFLASQGGFLDTLNYLSFDQDSTWLTLFLIGAMLLALLFVFWLATVSQSFIVHAAVKTAEGESFSTEESLEAASSVFLRTAPLNILYVMTVLLVYSLYMLPLYALATQAGEAFYAVLFAIFFVSFLVLIFCFNLLVRYAIAFSVTARLPWRELWRRSWRLFHDHWLAGLELSLLIYILFFVLTLAALVLLSLLFLIFRPIFLLIAVQSPPLALAAVALLSFISNAAVLWILALFSAFQNAAWSILFSRLNKGGFVGKLERLFHRH